MARIQLAYTHLPKWLQSGVTSYNKSSIELENGCKVIAAATSSDAVRGRSFACVTGDTKVNIKRNEEELTINIENIENTDLVLTQSGYKKFECIRITPKKNKVKISFSNGDELKCSLDHKLLTTNNIFVDAQNLKIGDFIKNYDSFIRISSILYYEDYELVYDLVNVEDTHAYYTNGVLSHNCVFIDECIGGDSIITLSKDNITYDTTIKEFYDSLKTEELEGRKYTTQYKVKTSNNFQQFYGIKKTKKQSIKIYFDDDTHIVCSLEHKFYENKQYVYANTLKIGDTLTNKTIVDIQENGVVDLYDLLEVENGHHYTMNGVEGSNCAFISKTVWDKFWTSTFPTISSGKNSKLIIVSCVTKDTMVITQNGIKTVESFIQKGNDGAYIVPEYSVLGKDKFNNGSIMVNSGRVPTKIIKSSHSELECSLEHKLWACKNGKYDWYKSSELEVGDYISIQYGMNMWGNNDDINFDYTPYNNWRNKNVYKFDKITPDLAYLIGLYIAEGYIDKYRMCITCGDDISYIFDKLGIKYTCLDGIHYTVSSFTLCEMFRYLGFDTSKKAKEKEIPERLFSMSKENIVAMLQGMFDGDGCSTTDGGISYHSASKKLIKQVQMLLNNFGILCMCRSHIARPTKRVKVESLIYNIELSKNMSKLYYNIIGFRLERKQKNNSILETCNHTRDSLDIIPYSADLIRKYHLSTKCNITLRKGFNNIQRKKMLEIKNIINDDYWNSFYDDIISENVYWEQIKSITDSENDVYDFSLNDVPNDKFCHSVIYNGIIGHQTPQGRNHFYDFWKNAIDGKSDMCAMEVNWWDVPGRDEEWRKSILKTMTQEQFNVEYGNSFDASSDTLISPDMFGRLERNVQQPEHATKVMRIYEPPQEGRQYLATVDCADVGADFSTISVIDITEFPWRQVAVYGDDSISHLSLPQIIVNVCTKYNMADVLVESNEIGNTVLYILNYDKEYENIIRTFDKTGRPLLGQKTTSKTKSVGCARFKDMVESEKLVIRDHKTFGELRHFCLSGTSYEAEQGFHDDYVMGLVNFAYYASTPQFKNKYDNNFSDEFQREYDEKIMEELMPLPIFSSRLGVENEDTSWLQ